MNTRTPESIIFVDLDGTLIATDLLVEALFVLVRRPSPTLLEIPGWLTRGRARFKHFLAQRVTPDVSDLPFRAELISLLEQKKRDGYTVILATASHQTWAEEIAKHLGLFDDILASNENLNLKGKVKLAAIEEYCRSRSFAGFEYIGDSWSDVPVWNRASKIYAVEPTTALLRTLNQAGPPVDVLLAYRSPVKAALRVLRPHQWIKNLLVFVPLILAHRITEFEPLFRTLVAFMSFSLCASAIYVVNDALDAPSDRHHHTKNRRPFASGALALAWSPVLFALPMLLAFALSMAFLPLSFTGILLLYLGITTLYSMWLKRKTLIDVFMLGGLYSIRLLAGGVAAGVEVSEWLMAFSMFIFTSLAFVKRYSELLHVESELQTSLVGRGYRTTDLSLIETMGVTSGYLAVLVLALYIHSPDVRELYVNRWALWLICPVILFWISRIWLKARRKDLTDDPVVFAVKDPGSLVVALISALLLVIASGVR